MSESGAQAIRAILFDKDGTLLDFNRTWLPPYLAAAEYLAGKSDGRVRASELMASGGYIEGTDSWQPDSLLASGSNQQIFDSWAAAIGRPIDEGMQRDLAGLFRRRGSDYVGIIPDLREVLAALQRDGYLLGVATMDDEAQAHSMLEALDLHSMMAFVCGADSGFGVKPEPGMVLGFCEALGLAPAEVAMVGDSPRDILMGQNAGAGLSIGVASGAHSAQALAPFSQHVLADVSHIGALLEAGSV